MPLPRRVLFGFTLGPGLVLALLAIVAGDVLSGVRTLAAAQAAWTRSVETAQWALDRQARLQDPADGNTARDALALASAQRQARAALAARPRDAAAARLAWQRGGVAEADLPALQRLFVRYGALPLMAEAQGAWAVADEALERLVQAERDLAYLAAADDGNRLRAQSLRLQVEEQRAPLERSAHRLAALLDGGARQAQGVVTVSFGLLALLLGAALGWTLLSLRQRQMQTEQALRDSNERWEMAAEGSCIGVFDWDVERHQVVLDPRAAAFWGFDVERPVVRSDEVLRLLVHRADQPRLRRQLAVALQHRRSVELRFRVVAPDGDERTLELSGRASGGPSGRGAAARRRASRMVGLLWDVTADVQSDRLRLQKEAAERASDAKTAFLSRVSHELRTPLNAVLGFAQLLQIDPRDPPSPQQAERIAHILAGGEHLLGLINDVLDLSVIDQGAFAVTSREVELVPLLRGSIARLEPLARTRRVSLKLDLGEDAHAQGWRAIGDPLRLEQVVMNLVSNAVKYNRLGGAVEVRVRVDGAAVRLEVHDTGPGLSPAQQARLFQPFDRLGAEFGEVPGSGLGLVITRQLVERMGGTLALRSEAGVGSTFTVQLRRATAYPSMAADVTDANVVNG